nr:MAG TPA: hypothetical protein [Caudoviricetes sp.]
MTSRRPSASLRTTRPSIRRSFSTPTRRSCSRSS